MPAVSACITGLGEIFSLTMHTMTVVATIFGLVPLMIGTGAGSEVMTRMAAPMVRGIVTASLLTMLVLPAIYLLWKRPGLQA